jgi:hypothetical protein
MTQALRWIVAGGLLVSSQLAAEPLEDLQLRLASLRDDQPIRLQVDVELKHRGTAPLHLNSAKQRGRAIVTYGPQGVESIKERPLGTSATWASLWRSKRGEETTEPLISQEEANDLVNPAGMLVSLLDEVTVVSDETSTWQGKPARLLVLRPVQLAAHREGERPSEGNDPVPLTTEAKLWLDESGLPLVMERSLELRLPAAVTALVQQTFTFQQVDGRLLVAREQETNSGTALVVLRSRDSKDMKVTVLRK